MGKPHGRGAKGYRNLSPQKTTLWSFVNLNTSSAATILEVNNQILWNSTFFNDFNAITSLYDEMRILKGKLHFIFACSTSASATPYTSQASCMVGFDPNLGGPTNVVQPLIQTFHSAPFHVQGLQSSNLSRPFHTLSFTLPTTLAPISASDCPGKAWFTLDAGTAPVLMVIQAVATALGTNGVLQFNYFVEFDVELKIRT
jgi:hypothetical protein